MRGRIWLGLVLAAMLLFSWAVQAGEPKAMVYKTPTCGCCSKWIEHLEENGFEVKSKNLSDVNPVKRMNGVPMRLASCHTAIIGGYFVEGHVPAQDVKRQLVARAAAIWETDVDQAPGGTPERRGNRGAEDARWFPGHGRPQPRSLLGVGGEEGRKHRGLQPPRSLKRGTACHRATAPPSTPMACPVTREARSEQSHTAASATSSASPSRPMGMLARIIASTSGFAAIPARSIGVSMLPGQIALILTPAWAFSMAAVRVIPITPCLLAQ